MLIIFEYLAYVKIESGSVLDKMFRSIFSKFVVIERKLYRKTENDNLLVLYSVGELQQILNVLHDRMGHFGVTTGWNWVKVRFWKPELFKEVDNYVKSCVKCQEYSLKRPIYKFDGKSEISGVFNVWYLTISSVK